jgi:hypothetical protein
LHHPAYWASSFPRLPGERKRPIQSARAHIGHPTCSTGDGGIVMQAVWRDKMARW